MSVKGYTVTRACSVCGLHDAIWKETPKLYIDCFPWDVNGYQPDTFVQVVKTKYGLVLRFETDEHPIRARYHKTNSDVYCDSCMEFFFRPHLEKSYMNLEFNAFGTVYVGICGEAVNVDVTELKTITEIDEKGWRLMFSLPFSFVRRFFANIEFPWKANFYKCGDETLHPHFGCWNPVVAEEPNFHLPEFFGTLLCKEEVKN